MVKERKSFTLVEIIAVIAILGVLASLAVVQYHKAILRAREKDAINQLLTLHAANTRYKSQTGKHWHCYQDEDPDISCYSSQDPYLFNRHKINEKLGINIIPVDGMHYEYAWFDDSTITFGDYDDRWRAAAAWQTDTHPDYFVVGINDGPLAMAFNDSFHPAICKKYGFLKPVCLVFNKIYDFLIPNAYAPCMPSPPTGPNPCCCRGNCPTLGVCDNTLCCSVKL